MGDSRDEHPPQGLLTPAVAAFQSLPRSRPWGCASLIASPQEWVHGCSPVPTPHLQWAACPSRAPQGVGISTPTPRPGGPPQGLGALLLGDRGYPAFWGCPRALSHPQLCTSDLNSPGLEAGGCRSPPIRGQGARVNAGSDLWGNRDLHQLDGSSAYFAPSRGLCWTESLSLPLGTCRAAGGKPARNIIP